MKKIALNKDRGEHANYDHYKVNTIIASMGKYIGEKFSAKSIFRVINSNCSFAKGCQVSKKQIAAILFQYFDASLIKEGSQTPI